MTGLKSGKPGEPRLAGQQPLDRRTGKGAHPLAERRVIRGPLQRRIEPRHHAFQGILRRIEQEIRLRRIADRLAFAGKRREQIGGQRKGRDIGRGRQERLEPGGLLALQGRRHIARLQLFEVRLPAKHLADRQRHLNAAPHPVEHAVLGRRQQRIAAAGRLDGLCKLHLAGAPHAARRDRRDEAPPGAGQRRTRRPLARVERDKPRHQRLRHGQMLCDLVFAKGRQAGIQTVAHPQTSLTTLLPEMT